MNLSSLSHEKYLAKVFLSLVKNEDIPEIKKGTCSSCVNFAALRTRSGLSSPLPGRGNVLLLQEGIMFSFSRKGYVLVLHYCTCSPLMYSFSRKG